MSSDDQYGDSNWNPHQHTTHEGTTSKHLSHEGMHTRSTLSNVQLVQSKRPIDKWNKYWSHLLLEKLKTFLE